VCPDVRKSRRSPLYALVVLAATGITACGGSSHSGYSASSKGAFCGADIKLDKVTASAGSLQQVLTILEGNAGTLSTLQANAPSGKIGTETKALLQAIHSAEASNNANSLQSVPQTYGGDLDTFCGVDASGDPLPAYFAHGKGSPFCGVAAQIDSGTAQAQTADDVLTFLKGHQTLLTQAAADDGGLPSPVKSEAQSFVAASQQAVSSNSSAPLQNGQLGTDLSDIDLYCGINH
jgi:hypothetical protein